MVAERADERSRKAGEGPVGGEGTFTRAARLSQPPRCRCGDCFLNDDFENHLGYGREPPLREGGRGARRGMMGYIAFM